MIDDLMKKKMEEMAETRWPFDHDTDLPEDWPDVLGSRIDFSIGFQACYELMQGEVDELKTKKDEYEKKLYDELYQVDESGKVTKLQCSGCKDLSEWKSWAEKLVLGVKRGSAGCASAGMWTNEFRPEHCDCLACSNRKILKDFETFRKGKAE